VNIISVGHTNFLAQGGIVVGRDHESSPKSS
jgi:hypothetical protein